MTTSLSLPTALEHALVTVWCLIDSVSIVASSSREKDAHSQNQLRLDLLRLRLSRWSLCAAATLSDPALSASCEASEDLLTELGAELERTLEQGSDSRAGGVGLTGQAQARQKLELTQGTPSSISSILHARIIKLVSSRRTQLGLSSQPSHQQSRKPVALSISDRSRFDFVTGWTSDTLTGLEGLLPAAAEKMRRELCLEEVDAIVTVGATKAEEARRGILRDVLDAVEVEVREHRDVILERVVVGRV